MSADNDTPKTIEIPLTRGYVATVDIVDSDLAQLKWHAKEHKHVYKVYATRMNISPLYQIKLHRVILARMLGRDLLPSEQTDHIDGNGLNNCRSNLRLVTAGQNAQNIKRAKNNTTGYKGVYLHKKSGKYQSKIQANGKQIWIGLFDTAEEAHRAYREASKKYHGEFGRAD